jgi:hypothetical protein
MGTMSMYVDLLSSVLSDVADELTGDALLGYTLTCRDEMLRASPSKSGAAYVALAAEVAYDRALLKLCKANNIEVIPANFARPREERARLEHELAQSGTDLVALGRRQSGKEST